MAVPPRQDSEAVIRWAAIAGMAAVSSVRKAMSWSDVIRQAQVHDDL